MAGESLTRVELITKLKEVRAAAIEHARLAGDLARQRRQLIEALLADGLSQADIARELGVTRQAIQKMVEAGAERRRR
jgi:DNA-binding NarL/FixJ family response regulator